MSKISIEVDFSEIINRIKQIDADVKKIEDSATLKAAKHVSEKVKINLPRSSRSNKQGYVHMQDDIKISSKMDEDGDRVRKISGGKKTSYKWRFLEEGTSKMPGTQFATRTAIETQTDVRNIIIEEVRKVLPE